VNMLLARPDLPPVLGPFVRGECWNTVCIFKRPGTCAPMTPALAGLVAGFERGPTPTSEPPETGN